MRKKIFAGFIGAALLSSSLGCSNSDVRASTGPPPAEVEAPVIQKDVPVQGEWIGTLEGYVNAQISPQVNGYLIRQDYHEGAFALAKPGTRREKLMSVYEALLLAPWKELIVDAPMGTEFYGACRRVTPDLYERRRKIQLKYTQAVLGTEEVSKVFMLAVDGLHQDLPATKVLRRRLEVLIDRFVRD